MPVVSWSQGNWESLFFHKKSCSTTGLRCCMLNPCCVQHLEKDVNYIRHFYQTGQAWNIFLQICEARGFERWHKSWIQFVLYSAINSAKWIFFKIQKKKKIEKLLAWKGCPNEPGGYQHEYSTISKWGGFYLHLIGLKANQPPAGTRGHQWQQPAYHSFRRNS